MSCLGETTEVGECGPLTRAFSINPILSLSIIWRFFINRRAARWAIERERIMAEQYSQIPVGFFLPEFILIQPALWASSSLERDPL